MDELAKSGIQESDAALAERGSLPTRWQDIADYTAPNLGDFTVTRTPGTERGGKIFNSHGVRCSDELAVRLDANLTGAGTPWFDVVVEDTELAKDPEVRGWLDYHKAVHSMMFNNPGSGFEQAKSSCYRQIVPFGNGPVYVGTGKTGWPVFYPEFLGNCAVWADELNWVTAVFRRYQRTAWRLAQEFGEDALPTVVHTALEKEPQKKFWCRHVCRPVKDDVDPPDFANRPFINFYVLEETQDLLGPVTYDWEFPWLWPRWDVEPNNVYGTGPGDRALQDVKMLQAMEVSITKHVQMNVDPTWVVPNDGNQSPRINQRPGGYAYAEFTANGNPLIQRMGPGGSAQDGMALREAKMQEIEKLYFLDAFKMPDKIKADGKGTYMSATEWAGRKAEQLQYAGPSTARLVTEFLYPLFAITTRILIRNKKLPPPPQKLRGAPVRPVFMLPGYTAAKGFERQSTLQLVGDIGSLAQFDPTVLDRLNLDNVVETIAYDLRAPAKVLATPEQVAAKAQGRAQAQQAQMQNEQLVNASQAALNNSKALQLQRGA